MLENHKPKIRTLDNGLVLATQNTQTHTIASKLRVNFGTYHENPDEIGLAHLLEHCLVTGGSKKFTVEESDRVRTIDLVSFGAGTKLGETYFGADLLPRNIERWLSFISDAVFNPRFDSERLEGERKRLLREIQEEKGVYFEVNQKIKEEIYRKHPKNSPLNDGSIISQVSRNKLSDFHSENYFPNNMDLMIAGKLPENIEQLVEKYFGSYKSGRNTRVTFPQLEPLDKQTVFHVKAPHLYNKAKPEESSADVDFMFVVAPDSHPDGLVIRMLSDILDTGTNSRLYKGLGLREGLSYKISVEYDGSYNAGTLNIYALVPAIKTEEAINTIFHEFRKLREEPPEEDELNGIKNSVEFILADMLDSNRKNISATERYLDEGLTSEIYLSQVREITPEKVREVARKYLPESRETGKYALVIGDPLKGE